MKNKGYTTPTMPKKMDKGMPVAAPKTSLFKAPDLTDRIPGVRPTSMRMRGPVKGK